MEDIQNKPIYTESVKVTKESKLPPAAQRKLDEANENLAKMTKEQLDMLFGVTKPEK